MKKYWALFLKNLRLLSCVAIRMRGVHPKHLVEVREFWVKKWINSTDVVLDLGCGNGERDFKIANCCKKIIGVDYDEKNIESAKSNAEIKGISNIDFIKDNILSFVGTGLTTCPDKIILLDVLEHIIEREKLLEGIYKLLKDNGLLLLSVPNKNTSWKKWQRQAGVNSFTDPDHKIEYSEDEIKSELKNSGFKIIEMKPDVIDTPLAPVFDLIGGFSLCLYKKLLQWKRDQVLKYPNEASGWEIVCISSARGHSREGGNQYLYIQNHKNTRSSPARG